MPLQIGETTLFFFWGALQKLKVESLHIVATFWRTGFKAHSGSGTGRKLECDDSLGFHREVVDVSFL